jgi:hypothetical protein
MTPDTSTDESSSSSLSGLIRSVLTLSILALAGIGVLVVLDILPRDVFGDLSMKVLAVGGIALVSGVALALLAKR